MTLIDILPQFQVLQQPVQNTAYVQQVYNAKGQMLMSGNIALHPGPPNMNPQIQSSGSCNTDEEMFPRNNFSLVS